MKLTLESTTKVVKLETPHGAVVQARVWEGTTDTGIPVHVFITRIAPTIPIDDPRQAEFQKELVDQKPPSAAVDVYPLRMIL